MLSVLDKFGNTLDEINKSFQGAFVKQAKSPEEIELERRILEVETKTENFEKCLRDKSKSPQFGQKYQQMKEDHHKAIQPIVNRKIDLIFLQITNPDDSNLRYEEKVLQSVEDMLIKQQVSETTKLVKQYIPQKDAKECAVMFADEVVEADQEPSRANQHEKEEQYDIRKALADISQVPITSKIAFVGVEKVLFGLIEKTTESLLKTPGFTDEHSEFIKTDIDLVKEQRKIYGQFLSESDSNGTGIELELKNGSKVTSAPVPALRVIRDEIGRLQDSLKLVVSNKGSDASVREAADRALAVIDVYRAIIREDTLSSLPDQ